MLTVLTVSDISIHNHAQIHSIYSSLILLTATDTDRRLSQHQPTSGSNRYKFYVGTQTK